MAIYSIYCQFKKHTGSGTCKHLSEQKCKQKPKLVSCHFTLNLCHITQSKKCTNSSPEILKFLLGEELFIYLFYLYIFLTDSQESAGGANT